MRKTKWLTWAMFYLFVITLTLQDCQKALNHGDIQRYGNEFTPSWAIAGLIAGTVLTVFWEIGYAFIIFSLGDRLCQWAIKHFRLEPFHLFSLF